MSFFCGVLVGVALTVAAGFTFLAYLWRRGGSYK